MSEPCMVCEGTNNGMLWHAQQPLWDAIVGRHSGLMCPPCFTAAASALGYLVSWTPMVTQSPGEVGGNSNHWHNETRDWLLMGQLDPEYPDRSEHPVWAVIRDALEAAGYPQPPMDYYPPENFALPSRANTDAGYHKLDRLARERTSGSLLDRLAAVEAENERLSSDVRALQTTVDETFREADIEAAERDQARQALQRLVDLKDGPRDERYGVEKPVAWQAARAALNIDPHRREV